MNANIAQLTAAIADRYRIERELGAGGMATVYLAHDVRHDRKVALKVLRPELSAILGAERFLAEIKTTANLQHPHILGLFDSGEAAGLVYYVMPFVEGESLRDRLKRDHQLPVEEAVRLAREVADALEYAHQQGIVHRDIKPENILLHGGHAVVADFGIALAASRSEGGARMTETGMSLGTPHYMSPEQAMGEREITPKADIYALGCVLYEMLTAEPPFTGASAQAIIGRVLTEEPRPLTAQRKTIPPHVEAAVQMALAKLPADRFGSAKEFAEALSKSDFTLRGTHAATAPAPGASDSRSRLRRLAPWALMAIASILALVGWLWPAPSALVTRQRTLLWDRPIGPGLVGYAVAIAPDGNTIVYVDTAGGTEQLWAKERDRIEATALAGTLGAFGPVFSPDGEWIAFVADGKVKRVPRLGGSAITVADSANSTNPALAWLDDGTLLFNNPAFDLQAIRVDGGTQRRVFWGDSTLRGIVAATPLPGGRGALLSACTFGCSESDLRVLDLRSGEARVLTDEVLKAWYLPGGVVVFVRRDGGVFSASFDLGDMEFRDAPVPVLDGVRASNISADMVLSASGTLLYVARTGESVEPPVEAVWVTRAGVASRVDSGWRYTPSDDGGIAISPDGRRLALSIRTSGTEDIWIKELPQGPLTRLTFEGMNTRPAWTADSRSVMFTSIRSGRNADLYMRRSDGTGNDVTLLDARRPIVEVVPTPDTSRFILRFGRPPTRDIHLLTRTAGSATTTPLVVAAAFEQIQPALSPNGRWLAYASNESGRYEVYVKPFPDANSGRWQVSRNGGGEPQWAHSGRELFYRDGSGALVAATVNPGAAFVLGEQRTLFPALGLLRSLTVAHWDVSPDDRRFLFTRFVEAPGAAISNSATVVIQVDNWLLELQSGGARRP